MAAPSWKWSVSNVAAPDLVSGSSDPMMGELHLWTATDWIGLMTTKGTPIVGKFLRKGDAVDVGSVMEFPVYSVKVIQCVLSPHVDHIASDHELMQMSGSDLNSLDQGWHVTYSTHRDLWRGRMKSYDGSLFFSVKHNWLLLKDAKGAMVGRRGLKAADKFVLGSKLSFPNHEVRIGTAWKVPRKVPSNPVPVVAQNTSVSQSQPTAVDNQNERIESSLNDNQGNLSGTPPPQLDDSQVLPSSAVFDAISMNLDFSYGFKFKADVKKKFGTTVHPLGKSNHFILVVSFGRAVFKLNEDMVGIALESCIGGNFDDLSVIQLNERVYRFSVSSKSVGFMINALSSAAVNALLQQDPFEIDVDVFVRFVPHNDRPNHRAVQGVRSGWLMVLSVPLDFRNDYDIANAVAAFGKYHSWHQDDVIKERTLIQASFDSPALVPRYIVFGNYSNIGGVKETWTALVYILGANFAEQLPADEDPMPLDGIPHPLPGNLLPPDNMFVLPQYPELGWNNVPNNVNDQHNNQDDLEEIVQDNDMQEQDQVEELVDKG
ncbi:hypothetical protein ACQ4PT_042395 [Festuca glaucescens]